MSYKYPPQSAKLAAGHELISGKLITDLITDEISTNRIRAYSSKFAPVVPVHFYQQFILHGYAPKTVLLLAHDVVENADAYAEAFSHSHWDDTTIFMDNSLVELKTAVDLDMVKEAVSIINRPNMVIVLPDAMGNGPETTRLTRDAMQKWDWEFRDHQLMAVIQGATMKDWLTCAESLSDLSLDWISIPRITENAFGYHRRELIPFAEAIFPQAKVHLLGFSDYIWEDLRAAAHYAVKSIDSAVPFRMATENILSEAVPKRGDWWQTAKFDPSMIDRVEQINKIISYLA